MIYTSYFARIKQIESGGFIPIGICAKPPYWFDGLNYTPLAPSFECLELYKRNKDVLAYTQRYNTEVLDKLDPVQVVNELQNMAKGRAFVLVCFEKPSDFCHRQLVASWLRGHGYACEELRIIRLHRRNSRLSRNDC